MFSFDFFVFFHDLIIFYFIIKKLFVFLQGAGKHLKDLQKSLKNPAANLGLVLSEGFKRGRRYTLVL